MSKRIKGVVSKLSNNKTILANFSYISILQVFILLTPLITYPYLTRVLGTNLYGLVITAQILASYAIIIVRFGFDSVSARHISIHREDVKFLSKIMASIFAIRFVLWLLCLVVYIIVILLIPIYRQHILLFLFSYGWTLSTLLFPQFFFQGIERMKYITFISLGIQLIFIALIFLTIRAPEDYLYVPLLQSIGYLLGGLVSIYLIYNKYQLTIVKPAKEDVHYFFRDALPLFATDAISTIKDKFNYLLLGLFVSMSDVVLYDVGSKLTNLIMQPFSIVNTVIFPKMAKNKSNSQFIKIGMLIFAVTCLVFILINICLEPVVFFLVGKSVELLPIRVFLVSSIFLSIGAYIAYNLLVARGYNRYMFYSIVITTVFYLLTLAVLYILGLLNSLMSFVGLVVLGYFVEMIYRLYLTRKILSKKNDPFQGACNSASEKSL